MSDDTFHSVSGKRTAAEAWGLSTVTFPPAFLSDLVIHYRGTAYHVHKLILCQQSSYFRTYIEQLTAGQRAYSTEECSGHSNIPHCVRLPDSCGKVEADCDDFLLFLCHLYFAQHYSCIPWTAPTDVDLAAQPAPAVSIDYTELASVDRLERLTAGQLFTPTPPDMCEAVVSLFLYFDCTAALKHAEHNCRLVVNVCSEEASPQDQTFDSWKAVMRCLHLAVKFDMAQLKESCIQWLASYCRLRPRDGPHWQWLKQQLDKDVLFDVMHAALDVALRKSQVRMLQ